MWNKILHQEEDLHQYVLQKLLHEAGPEHQSVGQRPINAVSSPKHWDWQSSLSLSSSYFIICIL